MADASPRTVAILGAGIGREHMTGYLALTDRFRVSTVCDLDAGRAAPVAAKAQGCTVTTDLTDVLADPATDIVDICLPPDLHFDVAVKALEAGKHVVCEKPLVCSVREADDLAVVAERTGRAVLPVFQYRFGRGFRQLMALIDGGLAGKALVATLETHWNRGPDYYAVPWRGTWAGERGGAVLGHAIHIHDLLCAALGPVARVSALLATRVNPIEVDDCAAIAFEMASGALATSSVTLGAAQDMSRLRFCFEHVTAESGLKPYAPATGTWTFTARDPARQAEIAAAVAAVPAAHDGYAGLFHEVAARLDGDADRAVTLADGRRSLELVSAIYHAARTGEAVSLPLPASHPIAAGWVP